MSLAPTPPVMLSLGDRFPFKFPSLGNADLGTSLGLWPTGLFVVGRYLRPTATEIADWQAGARCRIGLVVPAGAKHTFFLVFSRDTASSDAPYQPTFDRPDTRGLPDLPDGHGYLLTFVLIDDSLIVRALTGRSLTPVFSRRLRDAYRSRLDNAGVFSIAAATHEIDAAYCRWPRPQAMMRDAIASEIVGRAF